MQVNEDNEERDQLTKQMLRKSLREVEKGQQAVIKILEFLLNRNGSLIDDCRSSSGGSRTPTDTARADILLAQIPDQIPDKQPSPEQSSQSCMSSKDLSHDPPSPEKSIASRPRKSSVTGRRRRTLLEKPTLNQRGESVKQGEPTYTLSSTTSGTWKSSRTLDSGRRMSRLSECSQESTQSGCVHPSLCGLQSVGQHDKLGVANERVAFRVLHVD